MSQSVQSRDNTGAWTSLLLRLAVASIFFNAALTKLKGGMSSIHQTVEYFQKTFEKTWLPAPMVTAHAYATPFVEALIAIWLLTGFKLKAAWILTSLFMLSLAFGLMVAGNHDGAFQNYIYVVITCAGLHASRYDRFHLGGNAVGSA